MLSMPTALITDDDKRGRGPIRGRRLSKSARTWRKLTKKSSSSFNYANVTNKAQRDAARRSTLASTQALPSHCWRRSPVVYCCCHWPILALLSRSSDGVGGGVVFGPSSSLSVQLLACGFCARSLPAAPLPRPGLPPADRTYRTHLTS